MTWTLPKRYRTGRAGTARGRRALSGITGPGRRGVFRDLAGPRNIAPAGSDDLFVEAEVIPAAERRDMVRRLLALCHTANELVVAAEAGPPGHGDSSAVLLEHAQRIQAVLRDTVVDLVANGHAHRTDAA